MFLGLYKNPQIENLLFKIRDLCNYNLIILPILFVIIYLIILLKIIKTNNFVKSSTILFVKKVLFCIALSCITIFVSTAAKKIDNNNTAEEVETPPIKTVSDGKKNSETIIKLINIICYSGSEDKPGEELSLHDKELNMSYYLHIPENARKGMPLVIFLHGIGENGRLNKVKKLKPVKAINDGTLDGVEDFIFLAPVAQRGVPWSFTSSLDNLIQLIDKIVEEYSVDPSRIYITGFSAGGNGVWNVINKYPDKFRAAIIVSSNGRITPSNFQNTPVYAIVGGSETSYIRGMKKNVKLINEAGGNAELETIPRAGHARTQSLYTTKELFIWLLSQ